MSTYKPNYKAFDRLVLCAPFMVADMRKRAEKVLARAEATAPDAAPFGEGFKYSFEVSSGIKTEKTTRAYGRVTNTDPDAVYIEFGSRGGVTRTGKRYGATPAHRTLGRALDAAGD